VIPFFKRIKKKYFMINNHPILITGSHRSGTTWVGNLLKNASNTYYLHEPLTPNSITRSFYVPKLWYKYFDPDQDHDNIKKGLDRLFRGNYPLSAVFHFKNNCPIQIFAIQMGLTWENRF